MKHLKFLIVIISVCSCSNNLKKANNFNSYSNSLEFIHSTNNSFTAKAFTDLCWNNPNDAMNEFLGKEVIIEGILSRDGEKDNVYLQGSKDSRLDIFCKSTDENDFLDYDMNDAIKVKGICVGMHMNIELNDCVIID